MGKTRASYTAAFKLNVVNYARTASSNRETADHFGISEKLVRDWKKAEEKLKGVHKTRKRTGTTRVANDHVLEDNLLTWFKAARADGHVVCGRALQLQALRIKGQSSFKASSGWLARFKFRHSLSTRRGTSIGQKLPKDSEEKTVSFHRFILQLREQHQYELQDVFNMDETPLQFDMPGSQTLESSGVSSVLIRTNGAEKRGFTAVLSVAADGSKLPPYIIFKGKRDLKFAVAGASVVVQEKGYIDEIRCLDWISRTFPRQCPRKRLLVWDSCRAHLTSSVREALQDRQIDVAVIPGGLTPILQPLDVVLNRPFKMAMRRRWENWMVNGKADYTAGGHRRAPSREQLVKWAVEAWKELPSDLVKKSFLKTGISNAMDGTEDYLLWEDAPLDEPVAEDELESGSESESDFEVWDDSTVPIPPAFSQESDDEDFLGF